MKILLILFEKKGGGGSNAMNLSSNCFAAKVLPLRFAWFVHVAVVVFGEGQEKGQSGSVTTLRKSDPRFDQPAG